jgi:hypothetical protein
MSDANSVIVSFFNLFDTLMNSGSNILSRRKTSVEN